MYKLPTMAQLDAHKANLDQRIASAAAKALGWTDEQRAVYLAAITPLPPVNPDGTGVEIHRIGCEAVTARWPDAKTNP